MKGKSFIGVEIREEKNRKCYVRISLDDKFIYVQKGLKEFVFSKKEILEFIKEAHE